MGAVTITNTKKAIWLIIIGLLITSSNKVGCNGCCETNQRLCTTSETIIITVKAIPALGRMNNNMTASGSRKVKLLQ